MELASASSHQEQLTMANSPTAKNKAMVRIPGQMAAATLERIFTVKSMALVNSRM